MLSETVVKKIGEIKGKYSDNRSILLPSLYVVQREYGWISPESMEEIGNLLKVPRSVVRGTSTFYAMFMHKPMGRNLIQLCTNVGCMIMGAERLVDILKERYGLEPNSTAPDGRFSLVIMECIGACGTAPAMLVNTDFHDNLTQENIIRILESYT